VVHELLELFRREELLQFVIDSLHAFHVLRTAQALLAETRVLEMHAIDGVYADGVFDT
jgi:hypothetical protein